MGLVKRTANLKKRPAPLQVEAKHVAVGDLHGNALKLIYILIEEKILNVSDEDYQELQAIYYKNVEELTSADLARFKKIIATAHVNTEKALTLVGDDLADRGQNDYFTLLVLQRLHQSNLDMEILLSNHSVEFFRDYEREQFGGSCFFNAEFGKSLHNMQHLIKTGLVDEAEIRELVAEHYIPLVKPLSYSYDVTTNDITVFSHAPIGLETIQALAHQLELEEFVIEDLNPKALIKIIDLINEKIQALLQSRNFLSFLGDFDHLTDTISPSTPLLRLLWNRNLGEELKTHERIHFVHGHVGPGVMQSSEGKELLSHMNLDNLFGKASDFDITYEAEGFCVEHFTLDTDNLSPKNWLHWRALEPDLRKMVKNIYLSKQEIANMFHSIIESDLTLLLNPEEHRNFMHQVTQFKSISERFTSLQKELSLSKKEDLNPLVEYALRELDFAEAQEKIEDILKIVEYNQTHSPAREAFDSTRQLFKEIVKQERGTELQEVMLDEHELSDSDSELAGLAGLGSASL